MLIRPSNPGSRSPWLALVISLALLGAIGGVLYSWLNPPAVHSIIAPVAGSPAAPVSGQHSAEFQRGYEISQKACQSCHLYPEPQLLDRVTWAMEVLPAMRIRLGMGEFNFEEYAGGDRVKTAKIIPSTPALNLEEWRALCTYYLEAAPVEALPQAPRAPIQATLPQFTPVLPAFRHLASTLLVKIDESTHRIWIGDASTNRLEQYDATGKLLAGIAVDSPPVGVEFKTNGIFLTLIGSYSPSDELLGKVTVLESPRPGVIEKKDLLSNLARPAHATFADLNGDGLEDIIVSCYGSMLGHFSWYENKGHGQYIQHVLLDRPGAIRSYVYDFNHDGRPDIIVQMAAGREGIYIFMNDGHGEFTPVPVVEQPPSWGYSYFELVDFNHDGFMDILATNGDNGDSGKNLPCRKNYHGIRLYLNDGKNHFQEAWFYPLNGAYKAVARDFRGKGQLDIAAISFFPDYKNSPQESFVYLENQGGLEFKAYSCPESIAGSWITLDVGDVDGDGRPDIVLGAYNHGPNFIPHELLDRWEKSGPPFLILKNNQR